tara:strand:+ start:70 stop:297 length:228 start_codon:yes stop_codon:yes gene_type:complete
MSDAKVDNLEEKEDNEKKEKEESEEEEEENVVINIEPKKKKKGNRCQLRTEVRCLHVFRRGERLPMLKGDCWRAV